MSISRKHLTAGALAASTAMMATLPAAAAERAIDKNVVIPAGAEIGVDDLQLAPVDQEPGSVGTAAEGGPLQDYLDRVERQAINDALQKTRFNRTAAAKLLGVTFRSLRYRMERLGLKE